MVDADKSCTSCHKEYATYDAPDPAVVEGLVRSSSQVSFEISASAVDVCSVVFAASDGSSYVPVREQTVEAENGKVVVTLAPGYWALCPTDGSARQLVYVG